MLQYIPVDIFRASFKFFMGDKLRKKMEGDKRDVWRQRILIVV
jgi:hypothetical protein